MDLPYQTYEKITGKKWTNGKTDPNILSSYQKYGIKDAPGSAEANLALQKALLNEKPTGATSQSGIVQDTSATRAKDNETSTKIDQTAGSITGTGTSTTNTGTGATGGASVDTTTGDITGADGKTYKTMAPSGYTYNLPPLENGKKYVYDANGRPMVQDTAGTITNDPYADQEYEKNKDSITKTAEYNTLFDNYKIGLDATHQSLVDEIKKSAALQSKKMEELNARTLGAKSVQGARTGSAEYTPEIDTGIMKKEEEEGLARLAEIDANMKLAISQAVSAKTSKDFELASKRLETVNALQKAKEETIQNIYKNYVDNNKIIADKLKAQETENRASRDQALQELSTAAPELVKQYDSLKSDAERKIWLTIMAKKTGLDETILKGSLEKIRLDVRNKEGIIEKREAPSKQSIQKNYDEKSIPGDIKKSIIDDIKNVKGVTISQLYDAYPEVDTTYLDKLYNSLSGI